MWAWQRFTTTSICGITEWLKGSITFLSIFGTEKTYGSLLIEPTLTRQKSQREARRLHPLGCWYEFAPISNWGARCPVDQRARYRNRWFSSSPLSIPALWIMGQNITWKPRSDLSRHDWAVKGKRWYVTWWSIDIYLSSGSWGAPEPFRKSGANGTIYFHVPC